MPVAYWHVNFTASFLVARGVGSTPKISGRTLSRRKAKSLKVLVVSRGVKPAGAASSGGAELVMLRLAEQAVNFGHDVHLISDIEDKTSVDARIKLHKVGVPNGIGIRLRKSGFAFWIMLHFLGNLLASWRAVKLVRSQETPFDVIHCHGNLSGLILSFFKGSSTLVYSEHDSTPWSCRYPNPIQSIIRKVLYTLLDARLFRRTDLTLVLYSAQKTEIMERWDVSADAIDVVPNGVDIQRFAPVTEKTSAVGPSGYCLFVGRLESRKGVDTLIRALAECDTPCVIVGDGPNRGRLEKLAAEMGVAKRITFAGAITNGALADYYSNARMFVLPSHSEAFPLSLLESMACGTPFIASSVGANTDMVSTTDAGLLFDPGDSVGLAMKMQELINDTDRADELGRRGRMAAESVFSWPEIGMRLEKTYRSFQPERSAEILGGAGSTTQDPFSHLTEKVGHPDFIENTRVTVAGTDPTGDR